jgi:large subunit ribosomal protein L9
MQIILTQDIENLGYKNDVVTVRPGYARNFLVPRGYAIAATVSSLKVLKENIKQQSHKALKALDESTVLGEKLKNSSVQIKAKVGENGKIFGSVNTVMLAEALKAAGLNVERKTITINEESIKSLGKYSATAQLHKDIKINFEFEVVSE